MRADTGPTGLLARLCALGAGLMLVILTMSATIRLGQAGCDTGAVGNGLLGAARLVHRVAASAVGLLVLIAAFLTMRLRPLPTVRVVLLLALFGLTLFLAALGKLSAGRPVPIVTLGNVAAGVAMLVLFWRLRLEFAAPVLWRPSTNRPWALATLVSILLALQVGMGSWQAGSLAARVCDGVASATPLPVAGWSTSQLQQMHALSGGLTLMLTALFGVRLLQAAPGSERSGWMVLALACLLAACGFAATRTELPTVLWLGVAHNACAAVLLATLIGVRHRLTSQEN